MVVELRPVAPPTRLVTPRLVARTWEPADTRALWDLIDSENARFEQDFPLTLAAVTDEAAAARYIGARRAAWETCTGFAYGLWRAEAPTRCVGFVNLRDVRWGGAEVPRAEVAYFLRAEAEGQGLMREALAAVAAAGFGIGLVKLFARVQPGNRRSQRALLGVGFERGGRLRHDFRNPAGELVDVEYFDLLPGDLRGAAPPGAN